MARSATLLCCLLLGLGLFSGSVAAQLLLDESADPWSRFHRTILALQEGSTEEQADFALDALRELIEVYIAEADLALMEARQPDQANKAKLRGWSLAVDQYASQLMLVMEDIEDGFPLVISLGREGAVTVTVADRAVMLNHPRALQQSAFEQRVLAEFCSRHDCEAMTEQADSAEPIPRSGSGMKPGWAFTETGQVCSRQGIEVRFGSTLKLGESRSTCEELLQEADTLVTEIAWQRRHGVVVDWAQLAVSPTPQRPEHLVRLNAAGDSILVTLPLIYGSPGLLEDLKPWLRYRVGAGEEVQLRLDAADYGWLPAAH